MGGAEERGGREGWLDRVAKLTAADGPVLGYSETVANDSDGALALGVGGVLFVLGAGGVVICVRDRRRDAAWEKNPWDRRTPDDAAVARDRTKMVRRVAVFVSVVFYAILIGVNFAPEGRGMRLKAFGAEPFGLPVLLVVIVAQTLLYLPVPWIVWHGVKLVGHAARGRTPVRPRLPLDRSWPRPRIAPIAARVPRRSRLFRRRRRGVDRLRGVARDITKSAGSAPRNRGAWHERFVVRESGASVGRRAFLGGVAAGVLPLASPVRGDEPPKPGRGNAAFPGLIVREKEPVNLELPFPTLGERIVPNERFFVRTHFPLPKIDIATWRLKVEGHVEKALDFGLDDIRKLPAKTVPATVECAGNGRAFLVPKAKGLLWELGGVGHAEWTGVPLAAVLEKAGVRAGAAEVILEGADRGTVADEPKSPGAIPFERSLPLAKARKPEVLLAYRMNGEDLSAGTRLPAPGGRAGLVRHGVGQVAHADDGDGGAVPGLLADARIRLLGGASAAGRR